jgi:aminoglycoside/choline kinase family phosphotransferase
MKQWFIESFQRIFGDNPTIIVPIAAHASGREIYRLVGESATAIGSVNANPKEFAAFYYLTEIFREIGLPVAKIHIADATLGLFLLEDLGEVTLLDVLRADKEDKNCEISENIYALYRQAVTFLPTFQVIGGKKIDFSRCYPRKVFDTQSMRWDMEYYRDEFLYRYCVGAKQLFSKGHLNKDFDDLALFLSQADSSVFMYRDFQARNIVVKNGSCRFIDYDLGRRGPIHYDIASILYQSSAKLPKSVRLALLTDYLSALENHISLSRDEFLEFFDGFVLIRLLQVLGTYGKLGLGQGKQYFLDSIPPSLVNVSERLSESKILSRLPTLRSSLEAILLV